MGSAPASGVGVLNSQEAWARLEAERDAVLIDVRTQAEWNFVGVVDLNRLSKEPIFVEWQSFPEGAVNTSFVAELTGLLEQRGLGRDTELLFLCRSGARSLAAAKVMAEAGFTRCMNVSDGFEGPLDAERRRGRVSGWRHAGLPWVQG